MCGDRRGAHTAAPHRHRSGTTTHGREVLERLGSQRASGQTRLARLAIRDRVRGTSSSCRPSTDRIRIGATSSYDPLHGWARNEERLSGELASVHPGVLGPARHGDVRRRWRLRRRRNGRARPARPPVSTTSTSSTPTTSSPTGSSRTTRSTAFVAPTSSNILSFEDDVPRRARRQARAELPLDTDDPRRRQRGDRHNRGRKDKNAVDRRSARAIRSRSARSTTSTPRRGSSPARSSGSSTTASSRSEIAVFYRTNAQSRVLEDTLVRAEIAYQVIGGTKFYERAEIKDAIAYLTALINPQDAGAFTRIVNSPRRGIGAPRLRGCSRHANTRATDLGRGRRARAAFPGSVLPRSRPSGGSWARCTCCASAPSRPPIAQLLSEVLERDRLSGGAARPSARSRPRAGSRTSRSW